MPDKKGRFTAKEKAFVKAMSRPVSPIAAAAAAGYVKPQSAAYNLMSNPIVAEATRDGARQFLMEKAGGIGVYVLAQIALDEKQPAGARVTAGTNLAKLSGIAIGDGDSGKEVHEMTGDELKAYRDKLARQSQALDRALSERATPVIEADPIDDEPETGAFG